ncbi:MAG TPA: hypothetical protein QF353_03065 [Gammaproteobacteria bacterium]|nr:hypothetical protein [Gammaproteobacteria bacterium]
MTKDNAKSSTYYGFLQGFLRKISWVVLLVVLLLSSYQIRVFYQSFNQMKHETQQLSQRLNDSLKKTSVTLNSSRSSNFNKLSWMALTAGIESMSQDKLEQLKNWIEQHQVPCQDMMIKYVDGQLNARHLLGRAHKEFNGVESVLQDMETTTLSKRVSNPTEEASFKLLPRWVAALKPYIRVSKRKPQKNEVWLNSTDLVALKLMLSLQFIEAKQFLFSGDHQNFSKSLQKIEGAVSQYLGRSVAAEQLQNIIDELLTISRHGKRPASQELLSCLVAEEF